MKLPAPEELTPNIRKWKSYPGYKDSGVEWLGTIPEHWNVSTLKLLAPTINRGKSPDYVEDGGYQSSTRLAFTGKDFVWKT